MVKAAADLTDTAGTSAASTSASPPLTGNWGVLPQGPTAVTDPYEINEDETLNIEAAQGVLSNDSPASGGTLTVSQKAAPAHAASFTLNPDGSFTYIPEADYNGTDVFTYELSETGGSINQGMVVITIAAVNDPPTVSVPGSQNVDSGQPNAITGISVADVDAGTESIQVMVAATQTSSKLNMTIASGVLQNGNGGQSVQLHGTIDALNETLATLTYQNNLLTGGDVLSVQVSDNGNTGTGGSLYGQAQIAISAQ